MPNDFTDRASSRTADQANTVACVGKASRFQNFGYSLPSADISTASQVLWIPTPFSMSRCDSLEVARGFSPWSS